MKPEERLRYVPAPDLWPEVERRIGSIRPEPARTRVARVAGPAIVLAAVLAVVAWGLTSLRDFGQREGPPANGGAGPVLERAFAMQLRPVLEIVPKGDPKWDSLTPTCPSPTPTSECLKPLLVNKVVIADSADGSLRYVLGSPIGTGGQFADVKAVPSVQDDGRWDVLVTMNDFGTRGFARASAVAVTKPSPRNEIAIVVHGVVASAPTLVVPIDSGNLVIPAASQDDARRLAAELAP